MIIFKKVFSMSGAVCLLLLMEAMAQSAVHLQAQEYKPEPLSLHDGVGSTNVPMDSWVYPALERLAALDLITNQMSSIRPWTRQECARQMREARQTLKMFPDASTSSIATPLLLDLEREFGQEQERPAAVLDSAYTRVGVIAGPALTDGFHFGQTIWNDYGRSLARGTSAITGVSITANKGRYYFYAREEMQRSPATPGITPYLSQLFNQLDNGPAYGSSAPNYDPVTAPLGASYRATPIELYAGMAFGGSTLSFGKQQLDWGPTKMGSFSFSSNAEPTYNLRFVAARPYRLPLVPALGTFRFDLAIGKLSGHKYPARPYFNAQKIEFQFLDTLDVSFTRWSIFLGEGHPMTLGNLKRNLFSSASTGSNFAYGDRLDPGDRKGAFDFVLRIPKLRKYITLYADSYADDELNPINAPRRVAWSPGIYISHLPKANKLDLRFEMASSEELSEDEGNGRVLINNQYRDGNTNKGFLLGNAVGRDARAFETTVTYWKSARTTFAASYRQTKGGLKFLQGGSTISDASVTAKMALSREWSAQVFTQYERFLIPVMTPGAHHNFTATIQLQWNPSLTLLKHE